MPKSILRPEMHGSMLVSGRYGIGKTTFAITAENPKLIAFFDFDETKSRGLHEQLGFGAYYAPSSVVGNRGYLALWQEFTKNLAELPANQFTVAVIDNVSPLEIAMSTEVLSNPAVYAKRYGMVQKNITEGDYGGAKGAVNYMIGDQISAPLHAKGIQLIIVTAHTSDDFKVKGRKNIKGAKRWSELNILTMFLLANRQTIWPPAGLILKEQFGLTKWDEEAGKWSVQPRLPRRLPVASFETIYHYLDHPADLANPTPEEIPTPEEFAPFDTELSKEQVALLRMETEMALLDKQMQLKAMNSGEDNNPFNDKDSVEAEARKLLADGMSVDEVVKATGLPKVIVKGLQA